MKDLNVITGEEGIGVVERPMGRAPITSTVLRWGEIFVYAVIGGLIQPAVLILASPIQNFFAPHPAHPFLSVLSVMGPIAIILWLHWIVGFRFRHLFVSWRYPSLVCAVLIGIVLLFSIDPSQNAPTWFGISSAFWAAVVYLCILTISGLLRLFADVLDSPKRQLREPDQEVPITSAMEDSLNFGFRVKRILNYLQDSKSTVALVGPFGAGKTSLMNLVQEEAKKAKLRLWFSQVSCWGFDDAVAGQQTVLKQIVANLLKQVDCFAIQGMPVRYADALSKSSSYMDLFFRFIGTHDPDAQLRRVSPILGALNFRLVVIVEDTDRQGKFDTSSVEALLNRFREVPYVSFVVTAGAESRMDFMRLCEHTEVLPSLDTRVVLGRINQIWKSYRESYPDDVLIEQKNELIGVGKMAVLIYSSSMALHAWELQVAKLITTPRKLKATIRRFNNAWSVLHGEVDFEELLVASCLRACAPGVFSFLIRQYRNIHQIASPQSPQSDALKALKREWIGLAEKDLDLDAARRLVEMLCPAACVLFGKRYVESGTQSNQQFRSKRLVYKDRIFNESRSPDEISDQTVLRELNAAKRAGGTWMPVAKQLVESEEYLEVFNHFQPRFVTGEDLWKLAVEVVNAVYDRFGRKADLDSPGVANLFLMCARSMNIWPDYPDRVFEIIKPYIPSNFQYVTGVARYLLDGAQVSVCGKFAALVNSRMKEVVKGYTDLMEGLDDLVPVTLNRLLRLEEDEQHRKVNWNNWAWLGPILLDGIERAPAKFVPQVCCAIGLSFTHPELPSGFLVNEAPLHGIFGSRARELMLKLSSGFPANAEVNQAKYQIDFSLVAPRAQKWISEQNTKHSNGSPAQ